MKKWLVCFVLMVVMLLSVSGVYAKEMATLHFNSLEEYEQYFSSLEKKPDIVFYEDISSFGEFYFFHRHGPRTSTNFDRYNYLLFDSSGYEIEIEVNKNMYSGLLYTGLYSSEIDHIKEKMTIQGDLRSYSGTEKTMLELDGFQYSYVGGELHYVFWIENGYRIELIGKSILSDYPDTTDTLVGKLLNSETAPEAIQTIKNMKITEGLPKGSAESAFKDGKLPTLCRDALILIGVIAVMVVVMRIRAVRQKKIIARQLTDS